MNDAARIWQDACAALDCVLAGRLSLIVRARAGPPRERWLAMLQARTEVLRITADADPATFEPDVDLLASLAATKTVRRQGLSERLAGRVLIVAGAERLAGPIVSQIADFIDSRAAAGVVLVDEGIDDERPPTMIADRIAMWIDLDTLSLRDLNAPDATIPGLQPLQIVVDAEAQRMIVETAAALGIRSLRAPLQAIEVARAAAARGGRSIPDDGDYALAARLVLAPRATMLPDDGDAPHEAPEADGSDDARDMPDDDRNVMIDAARAVIPPDLLDTLAGGTSAMRGGSAAARRGMGARGRPGRVRAGLPGRGGRFDIAATLLAAAPMQRLRGRTTARLAIRRDDIRIRSPQPVQRAVTVFAVDASGSAAVTRLAEVKGAVERLLAESYVRRDEVALIAFRGDGAETLLPPTRSLARAKRELAGLPGGGTTPLAAGIVAGLDQALRSRAAGRAPLLLLLTDGGANVSRDGSKGRAGARADAHAAAATVARSGIAAVVIDSSPRGDAAVRTLAQAMNGRYFALPRVDDSALAAIVGSAR